MKEILTIIKNNKRLKIIMLSGISILLLYVIGVAYAAFTSSQNKLAANLKVNDLAYYMTTNDGQQNDRILKSKAGTTELFNISLTSLNTIQTKYELIYKVCTNSSCTSYKEMPNGFAVNISETTIDEIRGTINSNGTKLFSIVTINTSSSDIYIEISLNAGYSWNELALSNQITETSEFYQDDLKIISVVDGIEQTNAEFPTTPNYDVNITCTRGGQTIAGFEGSGQWNTAKNAWELTFVGLQQSGTVCDIEFIHQAITRIAVTTPPNKTVYKIGETFDLTGMVVTAYSATGSYNVTGYTVSPTTIASGMTSVTISYTESGTTRTCTQNITVKTLSKIDVTTAPTKTLYKIGETFNQSGMVVRATYSNGETANITGYTVSPTTIASGTTYVTISYTETGITKTCTQAVSTMPKLSDVVIASVGSTGGATDYGESTVGYRYSGASPYNFISFNGETWRIIGALDGSILSKTSGTKYVKLVLPTGYGHGWCSQKESCNLGTSPGLQYLNSFAVVANGAVEEVAWHYYYGGSDYWGLSGSASNFFSREQWTSACSNDGWRCYLGKIGTISAADYGYASTCASGGVNLNQYATDNCKNNNWMYFNNGTFWIAMGGG